MSYNQYNKKFTEDIKQKVYELREWWMMYKDIRKQVQNEFSVYISDDRINTFFKERQKALLWFVSENKSKIQQFNDEMDSSFRYKIEWDNIVFFKKWTDSRWDEISRKFVISIEEYADIVYDYSSEWGNISGRKILRKYQLNRELRSLIKSRLYTTKDENACPDVVLDYYNQKYGKESVEKKIIEVSSRAIHDKYKWDRERLYNEQFKREAEHAIRTLWNIDSMLAHIREWIKTYKPVRLPKNINIIDNHKYLFVAFWDLHFGRTTDVLLDNLQKLKLRILQRPETNIIIKLMGDIYETIVQGGMHSGQVEEMDVYGIKQFMVAARVIEEFLVDLADAGKIIRLDGITGNHDRISKMHDDDKLRMGGIMFYELLSKALENTSIQIQYSMESVFKTIDEWVSWIQAHGDNKFDKKPAEKILTFHWEYWIHNVILQWDKHTALLSEGKDRTRIGVWSMNIGNRYSEDELMLSSEAWATFATINSDWLPEPTFIRFKDIHGRTHNKGTNVKK